VFSYYYYLYLTSFIRQRAEDPTDPPADLLSIADTLLQDEVRDVFITRTVFDLFRKGEVETAKSKLSRYAGTFSKRKYDRFLRKQLADGLPTEQL
jgi:hypothetical protein